jgi:CheY-like chemotaxis protein/anti-sigma regulatory factor (Ser/Thr protein kinase)
LKIVTIIRQSSRWLIRVINDILDFSKLEAHQLQIERVPFMLDDVVDGACQVLAAKAREKGLVLTVEGKDLPDICRIGDPLRLRQILLNQLGNAVKFTAEGSVTLAVQADRLEVVLTVIDTGIGIPADKIDSLFQPYNQVRSDIARSYGGTGLGLSITKNLTGLMDGRLEVTSEAGCGSRFTVSLGLPSDVSSLCKATNKAAASHVRWRKPDLTAAAAQGAVVLCAEDNAINREVLGRVLDRLGFNYEMAEDGNAALALLDRRRHGAILTDAQMPGLDGWEMTQIIRQQEAEQGLSRLPIMMVTANALSESDARASAAGIDTVLTKPLNVGELEATLLGAVPILGALRVAAEERPSDTSTKAPGTEMHSAEVDLEVLVQLVGDDPETLSAMLDDFQAGVIAQHDQIRAAVAADDPTVLAGHAHSIKGAARYAGATNLAQICDLLEQRANGTVALDALAQDLASLETAVARLPAEVTAALSSRMTKSREAIGVLPRPYGTIRPASRILTVRRDRVLTR